MSEEKQLAVFQFNGMEVRTQVINNEPMFCLSDVCKVLEIGTPANVKSRLNQGGIDTINTPTSSGIQPMTFITEQNLYKVIFQSRKPEAEKFTDWVTGEVLPSIRKTGGYIAANESMTDDEIMARALQVAQKTIDRKNVMIEQQSAQIEEQQKTIELQAPDANYCRKVLASETLVTTNVVAGHLGISAKKLNTFLDYEGWIYRQGKTWCASCKIRDKQYCDYATHVYTDDNGNQQSAHLLKWTESGRRAVIELWNKRHNVAMGA